MTRTVFLLHVLSTLTMFGVIWTIQVVHYPLFARVGAAGWAAYEAAHVTRITVVVLPAMGLELVTAAYLVFYRPAVFPVWAVVTGLALVGAIWASTAFIQVPLHTALSSGFNAQAHERLVATNWIRTVMWSLRAGLVLWLASRAMPTL